MTASQSDWALFVVWAIAAERRQGECKTQKLANTLWAFATAARSDMAFFAASRVLLILSLLSLVGGIRAACMSSFFSRLVYECECNDAKTEIEKQKSIDA